MIIAVSLLLLLGSGFSCIAQSGVPDHPDEDFVIASVIVAEPGEQIY